MSWKKIVHWALFLLIIVYLISGLGITYYQIMGPLTFGLLTKALAFKIHNYLLIPFIIVLLAHIAIVLRVKK